MGFFYFICSVKIKRLIMTCSKSTTCANTKMPSYSTPKRTIPKVFICTHPHNRPSYGKVISSRVYIPWNTTNNHRRIFISRSGQYLCKGLLNTGTIYFCGEYEPSSEAQIISKSCPKAVHDNLIPARGKARIPAHAINTDPYVFGEHFKYICCQLGYQRRR